MSTQSTVTGTLKAVDAPIHVIRGSRVSLVDMLRSMKPAGASDLYLQTGAPVRIKKSGRITAADEAPLRTEAMRHVINCFLSAEDQQTLARRGSADMVYVDQGIRYRVHFARGHTGPYAAIRIVGQSILELNKLGLPSIVRKRLTASNSGLLLVCGSTDSGKTVTCTSLLDFINQTRDSVLLTLEDPLEYILEPQRSMVIQREVGLHTPTFGDGIRSALRENVDAIFVGEMRDTDTMDQVLRAGETGHLVITTLHAEDALSALLRIVGSYTQADQPRIRQSLASTITGVLYQRLLPRVSGGRVPCCETLWANTAVRTILRAGELSKLGTYGGRATGGIGYKECLLDLRQSGAISEQTLQDELHRLQAGQ